MELLVLSLPTIFCIFTGLLIAWSIQAEASLFSIIRSITSFGDQVRPTEYLRALLVAVVTVFLLVLLFVATAFASFHMVTILMIEIWYAAFLACLSHEYETVEKKIAEVKHSRLLIPH